MTIDGAGDLVAQNRRYTDPSEAAAYLSGRPRDAGRFIRGGRAIGFEVDAYDPSQPLTIDPVLSYATFLGTATLDTGIAVAIDPKGFLLLMGNTNSPAFAAKNGIFSAPPNTNRYPYIAKIDPAATGSASLVWLTVMGGSVYVAATSLASDAQGAALVAGWTQSSKFSSEERVPTKHSE